MLLTAGDMKKLSQVHPDLVLVILMAARTTTVPFSVMETSRSLEQQRINMKKGVSWTMNSRHLIRAKDIWCHAADLVPIDKDRKPIWAWPIYHVLAPQMKAAALKVGVPVTWGGNWRKPDGPHWELLWAKYP